MPLIYLRRKEISTSCRIEYTEPINGIVTMEKNVSDRLREIISSSCPSLDKYEDFYKHLHQNGELSKCEKETAGLIASRLREISRDLEIKTGIGGHGLIAIFRNGPGKTVLLRADIDALPVQEQTNLPYQSIKTMRDAEGTMKPVMHGRLHDVAC